MIGRDLLTPDEVRKMDNSKCLIFIRGFDPIMDDKFHTLESDEFALSTSLGMYDGKKQKDEVYEEEQVHFYIDAEGEDALEKSYRYQLENYGGIFKESNVFSHLEETQDGLYKIPFEYGGYMLKYESGQAEVLPAFDPLGTARIHAGGAVLSKIPVCGYVVTLQHDMQIIISCRAKERIIIVQNIEYLSERDLKYFEKKEALGEAIIIRIEPEALLSLDLDALFQDRPKDQTLSAEELESFLQGNQSATRQKAPAGSSERQDTSGIENDLLNIHLSPDQQERLIHMINGGASDEELRTLMKEATGETA